MDKSKFKTKEAMNRARCDYGLHPYEPDRPCKILGTALFYTCECGYQTTSTDDIWDHCAGKVCLAGEVG
jgi:hypothetical protein